MEIRIPSFGYLVEKNAYLITSIEAMGTSIAIPNSGIIHTFELYSSFFLYLYQSPVIWITAILSVSTASKVCVMINVSARCTI